MPRRKRPVAVQAAWIGLIGTLGGATITTIRSCRPEAPTTPVLSKVAEVKPAPKQAPPEADSSEARQDLSEKTPREAPRALSAPQASTLADRYCGGISGDNIQMLVPKGSIVEILVYAPNATTQEKVTELAVPLKAGGCVVIEQRIDSPPVHLAHSTALRPGRGTPIDSVPTGPPRYTVGINGEDGSVILDAVGMPPSMRQRPPQP